MTWRSVKDAHFPKPILTYNVSCGAFIIRVRVIEAYREAQY